jgi:hypothetical protein
MALKNAEDPMRATVSLALLSVALIAPAFTDLGSAAAATKGKAAKSASCSTHYGKGFAPTLDLAKFQSWEITAQATGNWPIMMDTFKNEKYDCKADGAGFTCHSRIDVCKG